MAVIVDTSAIYALSDPRDPDHGPVTEALATESEVVVIPQSVVIEASYLLWARRGAPAERTFISGLVESDWRNEALTDADMRRAVELLEQYADADIGFVDASVVAIAERLGVRRIYTLDQRDFRLVRPRHVEAFEILP